MGTPLPAAASKTRSRCGETDAANLAVHWARGTDMPLALRERLFPAVFEAFALEDYSQVGIREISKLSGLSSATIYKYFASKEILLTTVFGALFPFLAQEMARRVSPEQPADRNFRAMFDYLLDFYDRTPALPVTFFISVPLKLWMQSGGWQSAEVEPILRRILEAGQRRGELDPSLTVSTAMGLFYMHTQREVQNWYLRGRRWKLAQRVDRFFPLFWRAVAAPQSSEMRKEVKR